MLCKLSLKNIKKSFKDYTIYFFTLILGVAIFYVFNSIDSQTVMMNLSDSKQEIIQMMTNMLSGISVFISIVLGFLIIYASRFLMRRRHKEFGLYMLLGMNKSSISKILLLETFFIGLLSLVVGLGLGVILSQVMSLLVANMFEADMTQFRFVFSQSAMIKTIIYFGIIYVIVMIFNTIIVNKCKLIDLLQAGRHSENIKIKNPYLCTIIFIIAVIMLGISYYLVTGGIQYLQDASSIFIPIILGCLSTFLIFWSLSGLLLKILMAYPKLYYKNLNCFTLRQVSSKINTTVISMSVICIMLFITICVSASALSLKNSMNANLTELAPMDISLSTSNLDQPITTQLSNANITSQQLKDAFEFYWYQDPNLTIKSTLGTAYDTLYQQYPYLQYDAPEDIIRISDYNQLASLYGQPTYTLAEDEYMIIANFDSWISIRNQALSNRESITIKGKTYVPKYTSCQEGFVIMKGNHTNTGIILVPDEAVDSSMRYVDYFVANYQATSDQEKENIEQQMLTFAQNNNTIMINTKLDIYEASIGLGAIVTFIGLYLGIIFLISSAAILALKELSDSADNKQRYTMLRKLGADEKLINRSLLQQIAIFFLLPLALATIHSIFGIMFSNYIFETFGNEKLLVSILMTACFLIIIYGGYFLITYFCSKNIIRERA